MGEGVFNLISPPESKAFRIHAKVVKANNDYEGALKIIILQEETAWQSSVKFSEIEKYASSQKCTPCNYSEKLLDHIRTCPSNIEFLFSSGQFLINEELRRNIKVKLFEHTLERINYGECVEELLDYYISRSNNLFQKAENQSAHIKMLETCSLENNEKLIELGTKYKTEKEELIGKFVLILNEKKQRIQHLTELLEAFKSKALPINSPVVATKHKKRKAEAVKNKNKPKMQKQEVISESDDSDASSNYNTDTEDNKTDNNGPKASTSNTQLFQSLIDKEEDVKTLEELAKREIPQNNTPTALNCMKETIIDDQGASSQEIQKNEAPVEQAPNIDFNTQQLLDML